MTLVVGAATITLPYWPFGRWLGFTPLPGWVIAALLTLTGLYVAAAEIAKKFFYARTSW
jgi:Mg2+-importing ATPase